MQKNKRDEDSFKCDHKYTFLTCSLTYKNNETWHVVGYFIFYIWTCHKKILNDLFAQQMRNAPLPFCCLWLLDTLWSVESQRWPCNNDLFFSQKLGNQIYDNPGREKFSVSSFQKSSMCVVSAESHIVSVRPHGHWETYKATLEILHIETYGEINTTSRLTPYQHLFLPAL